MLQHIYNDERGVTCFDRYFDHLTRVAHSWPPALRDFAQEDARYVLNGPRTLHDAWLCQLRVNKMNSRQSSPPPSSWNWSWRQTNLA